MRTAGFVFVVETKAQSALSDANVQRKQRAAISWTDQITELEPDDRSDREWHYVLLGEQAIKSWRDKNARSSELLEFARLRLKTAPAQEALDLDRAESAASISGQVGELPLGDKL